VSFNIFYIIYYFSLPVFNSGNGTLTSTRGRVTEIPSLLAFAAKTAFLLAAPPTVTDGSFSVRAQPTIKEQANAVIVISLITFISSFIIPEFGKMSILIRQNQLYGAAF